MTLIRRLVSLPVAIVFVLANTLSALPAAAQSTRAQELSRKFDAALASAANRGGAEKVSVIISVDKKHRAALKQGSAPSSGGN